MPRCLLLAIATFIVLFPSLSSSQSERVLSPLHGWNEWWTEDVPVSGAVRVGLMDALDEAHVEPTSLSIRLPQTDLPQLCVGLSSQDGRYSARLEYKLEENMAPGRVRLAFPTRHASEIRVYPAKALGVLAQLATSCAEPDGPFVVASWRDRPDATSAYLQVNSRLYTDIQYVAGSGAHIAHCDETAPTGAVSFNLTCRVPIGVGDTRITGNIRRRRLGRWLPPVLFAILLP